MTFGEVAASGFFALSVVVFVWVTTLEIRELKSRIEVLELLMNDQLNRSYEPSSDPWCCAPVWEQDI